MMRSGRLGAALLALLGLSSCAPDPVGQAFPDKSAAEKAFPDWVVVGTFGSAWPAKLLRAENGRGSIAFVRKGGTRHEYPGFDGYRLKALFFEDASGAETVLVLRSREKG
jgi:hypothetical protein